MRAERGLAACAIFLLALSACSQNDGGPGEGVLPSPSPSSAPPVSPTPLPGIKQGQIHDSAITGLNYRSASLAGTTNLFGQFDYRDGERVAFLIGDIAIGETAGAPARPRSGVGRCEGVSATAHGPKELPAVCRNSLQLASTARSTEFYPLGNQGVAKRWHENRIQPPRTAQGV